MSQLLDPKILLTIKDLQLAARTTIDGFMTGVHKSTVKGEGLEFSQYRSYQPGDDLRQLDWKLYARSDRYFVRESEAETSISVRFILDASASMAHTDNGYTKMQYAAYLAACLGWLLARQGDAVGLFILEGEGLLSLETRRGYQHMNRFYHLLENVKPSGKMTPASHYKTVFTAGAKRELVIFISDLYEQDAEISAALDNLAIMKHEVMVFQLMADNELQFNFGAYAALEDLETGKQIKIDTRQDTAAAVAAMERWLADTKMKMLARHFFYRLLNTAQPVDQALRDFLKQRSKLRG